jgi:hypothetical protein
MCFVFIWEPTATGATYSINCLVFTAETKSVYCAVRTGNLSNSLRLVFKGLNMNTLNVCPTIFRRHTSRQKTLLLKPMMRFKVIHSLCDSFQGWTSQWVILGLKTIWNNRPILNFISYFRINAMHLHYKDHFLCVFREKSFVYCDNHTRYIDT